MHAFDVLGDPVRRRILELLAAGEHSSGDIVLVVQRNSPSRNLPCRSSFECFVRADSHPCGSMGRAASILSSPVRCATSTTGSTDSECFGHLASTRWPPRLREGSGNGANRMYPAD